uniref:Terpene synthase N-terminal domain-containing protein n=1 Tax=Leersia perrieri TaxID=77586 RepID=A0A0D9VBH9_9ORYZ
MAYWQVFSSSLRLEPFVLSPAADATAAGCRSTGGRRAVRPSPAIYPGLQELSSHSSMLSTDFDIQVLMERHERLTNDVKEMLQQQRWRHYQKTASGRGRKRMTTIDHLKRLCIDHYFPDEVDRDDATLSMLEELSHGGDLLDATLALRLMREAGHNISADEVLERFTDDNGNFRLDYSKDIRGLLSLQDISHMNMGEEVSLCKAKEFSSRNLKSAINYLEPNLARYVRHTLDHPYHVSLMQYKARHHLSYLQILPTRCTAMEELALADFQLNKLLHQMEMQEIKRWWMDLGLAQEIPVARDQVQKWWDLAVADSLPRCMRSCYRALYTVTNNIGHIVEREHGVNPINHLKKAWAMLFDGFMTETKWLSAGQSPASEDYLRNGVVTSGLPLVFVHLLCMLGQDLGKDATEFVDHIPSVISCPAKILRLWDDLGSAKDEAQEGLDGSYKEIYLKENPGLSASEAEEHVRGLILGEWEQLNCECFSSLKRSGFSNGFTQAALNIARMVGVMYGYDGEQRLPVLDDYIRNLLF